MSTNFKMQGKILCIYAFLWGIALGSNIQELPDFLKRCNRNVNSQDFNACLRSAIEDAVVKLQRGYEPLSVQSIDPLKIDKIIISRSLGLISLDVNQKDATIRGFGNGVKIESVDFNFEKNVFSGIILAPKLVLESFQILKGKILGIPITWKGDMECLITKMKCSFTAPFKSVHSNGTEFLKFNEDDVKLILDMNHVKVRHIPSSPNEKILAATADKLINDNWKLVYNLLKPSYENIFRKELGKAMEGLFDAVPLRGIFLD